MPALQYGLSSYERAEGDLPGLPVVNMYVEETASEAVVLQSRPPLVDRSADMGSGPIRALFKRDGVISGVLLGVSNMDLYNVTTSVGTITGSGPVSIAGNETGVLVCAGDRLYSYDGATFATVTLPDNFNALKVIEGASRFVVIRGDSGSFYFSPPLLKTFDGLDFATAEAESDQLLDALFLDDTLILFGRETVEFWPNTTDNNLPFQALENRVLERGIRETGCATNVGSTFAWITEQNTICIGDENNIISNPGLQERLAQSVTASLFNFFIDGTEFLACRMDDETEVYNSRTGTWSKGLTNSEDNWLATCHAAGVFGSPDGKTLAFGDGYSELGGVLERRFRAGFPLNGGAVKIDNLRLRCNVGQTGFLEGQYANPVVEMRISRDAGQSWGDWIPAPLGAQGEYLTRVEWRALGLASAPGILFEFRVTDPVPFRVSGVFVNEPYGGRR